MIIKKKYTNIKQNKQESELIINDNSNDIALTNENKEELNNSEEIINQEAVEETEKKEDIVEEKPKTIDLDLTLSELSFEPREERREGTRRRGYRRTQDRNIVSRAQKEALSIKEIAKQDGYKEGLQNAQNDIDDLKSKFAEFYNYKDEVFEKVSECILDVSVEIAKKIINKEIETDKTAVLSMIKGVVEEINKTENKITLKVLPKDVELVRDKVPELFSESYFEAKISVVPDNNIKDGGVIVETSNGIIDATIETQISIIEKALKTAEEN